MLTKALLTTAIIGSSAVASARPVAPGRTIVRDHREPARVERREERRDERREQFRVERREPVRFERREERREHVRYEARWRPIVRERFVQPVYTAPLYAPTYVAPYIASPFVNGQLYLNLGGASGNAIELGST